ncbi:alpha/beta hydrolase [Nocardiopsis alba]|uniref:Alpha/beta hydrolase fold family protein n=1 Tax=Nocardiopsis alba (strain ATCC BAA-2165 / BE74) TaxID=1205910 RepID=J7KZR1_NOCAA|nr:alpha/beta hydrolase [Nocardiopsis alba]AFR06903.1 alpha/beta hydrolase fold family protein [Nocardiopsis alba ATCC BAA-2165]
MRIRKDVVMPDTPPPHPRLRRAALISSGLLTLPGVAALALVLAPPLSWEGWQYALLTLEFSLFLALPALLGLLLALSAGRGGRTRVTTGFATVNALLLITALVPSASLWNTARAEGAPLSLGEYTAGPATSTDREPTTLTYHRVDGEELLMDVWEPASPGTEPLPVVVNVHGGADDLPQSLLPRWDTWLADGDRVVFDVDYRFFPDGAWEESVADVRCALGRVREQAAEHGGDPERIAVTGQSAGGLLALLATYDDRIPPSCDTEVPEATAVVAWYSATDGTADAPEVPWRQRRSPLGDELLESSERMVGGPVTEFPEEYEAMSPILDVTGDSPATLVVTAGHDLFVDPEDNRRFVARLAEAGVPHRHLELPWTEHMFDFNWGGLASQITRHTIDDFLTEHL